MGLTGCYNGRKVAENCRSSKRKGLRRAKAYMDIQESRTSVASSYKFKESGGPGVGKGMFSSAQATLHLM